MSDVKRVDCLLIGRFQPFHLGHLEVVRKIAKECDELIIGIGSAQISHTFDNPFTAGERHLMISRALREDGIKDFFLVPIVDINQYGVWVSHVRSMVPPFERVYTNNPLTKRLFSEAGYEVSASPMFNRSQYSGGDPEAHGGRRRLAQVRPEGRGGGHRLHRRRQAPEGPGFTGWPRCWRLTSWTS